MKSKVLIISARNFGDAIIAASLAENIGAGELYDVSVLTKSEYETIFARKRNIKKCYYTSLPIAGNKKYNIFDFINCCIQVRREQMDIGIDISGDFRERAILKLMGVKRIISLERQEHHPYNNLIRKGLASICETISIPENVVNIYESIDYIYRKLNISPEENKGTRKKGKIVGIHPFASQACRMWPLSRWDIIIDYLISNNYDVKIFCTDKEKKDIINNVINHEKCHIISGDLNNFFSNLEKCSLLLCLDSFAYHAAYSIGVPSIMLNGANDYRIWKTRNSKVILNEKNECRYWPCYNVPKCFDYECIRNIKAQQIMTAISEFTNGEKFC